MKLNEKVFSFPLLKAAIQVMFLISSDSPFHRIGAATKRALLPYLLRLKFGTVSNPLLVDLKSLLG